MQDRPIGGENMKPTLPPSRSRPQLNPAIAAYPAEPRNNHRWTSKTFPDGCNTRMMTDDDESEYEMPVEDSDQELNYDYVVSSSLNDLRHVKIWPAKPIDMQSVYADKNCLPSLPPTRFPMDRPALFQRPSGVIRQHSVSNDQPNTYSMNNNNTRGKNISKSNFDCSVVQFPGPETLHHPSEGPSVDRRAKPFIPANVTRQSPEKSSSLELRQPAPPPRPPKHLPKDLKPLPPEPSHTQRPSGPNTSLNSRNSPLTTQPGNGTVSPWKNKSDEIIPIKGIHFRCQPDIHSPNKDLHPPIRNPPLPYRDPPLPSRNQPSPSRDPPLPYRDPLPLNRDSHPPSRDLSPLNRGSNIESRDQLTPNKDPSLPSRNQPLVRRDPPTPNRDLPTPNRDPPTPNRDPPTPNRDPPKPNRDLPTPNRDPPLPSRNQPFLRRDPPTPNRDPSPLNRDPPTLNRDLPTPNRDPPPLNRDPLTPNRDPPFLTRDLPISSRDSHSLGRDQQLVPFRPKPPIPQTTSTSDRATQIPVKPSENMPRRPEMQSNPHVQKAEHFFRISATDLEANDWYMSSFNRYEAERALTEMNKDGSFLIRDSSKKDPDNPYVLVVYYANKVYNIQIRYFEDSEQFALGTGLRGHDKFHSVSEMIKFHRNIPLRLIDRRDESGMQMEECILTSPLGPY